MEKKITLLFLLYLSFLAPSPSFAMGAEPLKKNSNLHDAISRFKINEAQDEIKRVVAAGEIKLLSRLNSDGQSPLHLAAVHGLYDIVVLLVESGAKVNKLNKERLTPCEYAWIFQKSQIRIYLQEKNSRFNQDNINSVQHIAATPRRLFLKQDNMSEENKLKIITKCLSNEEEIINLIFIYPLIFDDSAFFEALELLGKDFNNNIITLFELIISWDYPNGHTSRYAGTLRPLLNKIGASIDLKNKLLTSLILRPRAPSISLPSPHMDSIKENLEKKWKKRSPEKIAEALAKRDQSNFKKLSLKELNAWRLNPDNAHTVEIISEIDNATTNWVVYEILIAKNPRKIYNKFIKVGSLLLDYYDYEGAFQVISALTRPEIIRLNFLSEKSELPDSMINITSFSGNFRNYRSTLSLALLSNKPVVPNISLLCGDLTRSCEMLSKLDIEGTVKVLINFHNLKLAPDYSFDFDANLLSFLSQLKPQGDETLLNELSEFKLPGVLWLKRNKKYKKKPVSSWLANDIVNCLTDLDELKLRSILFKEKIYNGKSLLLMLENIPKKIRGTKFLEYVSKRRG